MQSVLKPFSICAISSVLLVPSNRANPPADENFEIADLSHYPLVDSADKDLSHELHEQDFFAGQTAEMTTTARSFAPVNVVDKTVADVTESGK